MARASLDVTKGGELKSFLGARGKSRILGKLAKQAIGLLLNIRYLIHHTAADIVVIR